MMQSQKKKLWWKCLQNVNVCVCMCEREMG